MSDQNNAVVSQSGDGETPEGVILNLPGLNVLSDYLGSVTFLGETAGYRNTLGMYEIREDGSFANVSILFANASLLHSGGNLLAGESKIDVSFKAGTKVGFFIVPDGASSPNAGRIEVGQETDSMYEFRDAEGNKVDATHVGNTYLWLTDRDGGEYRISGAANGVTWHSMGSPDAGYGLNGDGLAHTVFTLNRAGNDLTLDMGFEDLWNGGDKDYDDVMFRVDLGAENLTGLDGDPDAPVRRTGDTPPTEPETPAAQADLVVRSMALDTDAPAPGEDVTVTLSVGNLGDADAQGTSTTFFWSATDRFDLNTAVRIDSDNHGELKAGETENGETTRIRYEDLSANGDGYLFAMIDAGGAVSESDEENNVSDGIAISFAADGAAADLTIASLSAADTSLEDGQDLFLNAAVSNQGTAKASDTATTYYWSATDTFDAGTAVRLATDGHGTLDAGETDGNEVQRIRYEVLNALGDGFVFGVIDAANRIAESDEGNNVSEGIAISFETGTAADLVITDLMAKSTDLSVGEDLVLTADVANTGGANASGVSTTYYWSASDTFDAGTAVKLGTDGHGRLRAGASDEGEVTTIKYEALKALGNGYVFGVIDAANKVAESNEGNNVSDAIAISVATPGSADLEISRIMLRDNPLASGKDLFVHLDVTNTGGTDIHEAQTRIYWQATETFDANLAVQLAVDNHGLLRAGETERDERTRIRYEDVSKLGNGFLFGVIGSRDPGEGDDGNNLSEVEPLWLRELALIGDVTNSNINGTALNDMLVGQDGNDVLLGRAGADLIMGGEGLDAASYWGSASGVQVDLAAGTAAGGDAEGDVLDSIERLYGSNHNDVLTGDAQINHLVGRAGNDLLSAGDGNDYLRGDAGADTIDGGEGRDMASYSISAVGVHVDLSDTLAEKGGDAEGDVLIGIEVVQGSRQADMLKAGADAMTLIGLDGDDTITGGARNDNLHGNIGNDVISAGHGNDNLSGQEGDDMLTGGLGNDIFNFDLRSIQTDHDTITDFVVGQDRLRFWDVAQGDLSYAEDANGDLVISFESSSITLLGLDSGDAAGIGMIFV